MTRRSIATAPFAALLALPICVLPTARVCHAETKHWTFQSDDLSPYLTHPFTGSFFDASNWRPVPSPWEAGNTPGPVDFGTRELSPDAGAPQTIVFYDYTKRYVVLGEPTSYEGGIANPDAVAVNGGEWTFDFQRPGGQGGLSTGAIRLQEGDLTILGSGVVPTNGGAASVVAHGPLIVADTGDASLLIEKTPGSGAPVVKTHDSYIGYSFSPVGHATVRGEGATWETSALIRVGHSGVGFLDVEGGGRVFNPSAYVGYHAGSHGFVNVVGGGSSWNIDEGLHVGFGGSGRLSVEGGGTVGADAVHLNIGGSPSVAGSISVIGSGSSLTSREFLNLSGGTLQVQAGGYLESKVTYAAGPSGTTSDIAVTGAGSRWENSGALLVGREGTGTLEVTSGGVVTDEFAYLGEFAGGQGTAAVSGEGSAWRHTGALLVAQFGEGELTVEDGGGVSSSTGYVGFGVGSNGRVTVSGIGSNWVTSGTLFVGVDGTANLTVRDQATVAAAQLNVGLNGELGGDGVLSGVDGGLINVVNHGLVFPGDPHGALTIDGNFIQTADGDLRIEIGEPENHDRLLVGGHAALGGALTVELVNAFSPRVGDAFDLIDWGGVSGEFESLLLPTLPGDLTWDVSNLYSDGVITVAEETVLAGDFNDDGIVNAADYTMWRDHVGATEDGSVLAGNGNGGIIDATDYALWRENFGLTAGRGSTPPSAAARPVSVPEPTALLQVTIAVTGAAMARRRKKAPVKISRNPRIEAPRTTGIHVQDPCVQARLQHVYKTSFLLLAMLVGVTADVVAQQSPCCDPNPLTETNVDYQYEFSGLGLTDTGKPWRLPGLNGESSVGGRPVSDLGETPLAVAGFVDAGGGIVRWTGVTGAIDIPVVGPDRIDISGDGSTILTTRAVTGTSSRQAATWTDQDGFQPLGSLLGGNDSSRGFAISRDGRFAVGRASSEQSEAGQGFYVDLTDDSAAMLPLAVSPSPFPDTPMDVVTDGDSFWTVGRDRTGNSGRSVVWRNEEVFSFDEFAGSPVALAVVDGVPIVAVRGRGANNNVYTFGAPNENNARWGHDALPIPRDGVTRAIANDISTDGRLVVGLYGNGGADRPVVWEHEARVWGVSPDTENCNEGFQCGNDVQSLLEHGLPPSVQESLNFAVWSLNEAVGVTTHQEFVPSLGATVYTSAIVGNGVSPEGVTMPWMAKVRAVPELIESELPRVPVPDGGFESGAAEWVVAGEGTLDLVPSPSGIGLAGRITTETEASVSQLVDTPDSPFLILLDQAFATSTGSTEVSLGGTVIDHRSATDLFGNDLFTVPILVAAPELLGRKGVELEITVFGDSTGQLVLDNVSFAMAIPEPSSLLLALSLVGFARVRPYR